MISIDKDQIQSHRGISKAACFEDFRRILQFLSFRKDLLRFYRPLQNLGAFWEIAIASLERYSV